MFFNVNLVRLHKRDFWVLSTSIHGFAISMEAQVSVLQPTKCPDTAWSSESYYTLVSLELFPEAD